MFPGEPYKFHLKPEHKPARHAPRKVLIHLEDAFKEEIKSLVKLGILQEVKEHTDWVHSYVTVEKDSQNHHSPNHAMKRELKISLDPRYLNETLEIEPYYTCSVDEIITRTINCCTEQFTQQKHALSVSYWHLKKMYTLKYV